MKNWTSLEAFFKALNDNVEYLVLRNYEEFESGSFNAQHPDIDVLCRDQKVFIKYAECESRTRNPKDLIHQQVLIKDVLVSLDIRHVGDGYYDEKWEIDMLKKRKVVNNLCYVMDEENYYFSLLYHALVQKRTFSEDYKQKLGLMAESLSSDLENPSVSLHCLQSFMRLKKYYFTFPEFVGGIANFSKVDKSLIKWDVKRIFHRICYKVKRTYLYFVKKFFG